MSRNGDLRRGNAQLVPLLAADRTYAEVASVAGISERTISRRMQDDDFRRKVQEERDQIIALTRDQLTSYSLAAVKRLAWNLHATNPAVEVSAARAILDHGRKLRAEDKATQLRAKTIVVLLLPQGLVSFAGGEQLANVLTGLEA
jgi:hypothetical protein